MLFQNAQEDCQSQISMGGQVLIQKNTHQNFMGLQLTLIEANVRVINLVFYLNKISMLAQCVECHQIVKDSEQRMTCYCHSNNSRKVYCLKCAGFKKYKCRVCRTEMTHLRAPEKKSQGSGSYRNAPQRDYNQPQQYHHLSKFQQEKVRQSTNLTKTYFVTSQKQEKTDRFNKPDSHLSEFRQQKAQEYANLRKTHFATSQRQNNYEAFNEQRKKHLPGSNAFTEFSHLRPKHDFKEEREQLFGRKQTPENMFYDEKCDIEYPLTSICQLLQSNEKVIKLPKCSCLKNREQLTQMCRKKCLVCGKARNKIFDKMYLRDSMTVCRSCYLDVQIKHRYPTLREKNQRYTEASKCIDTLIYFCIECSQMLDSSFTFGNKPTGDSQEIILCRKCFTRAKMEEENAQRYKETRIRELQLQKSKEKAQAQFEKQQRQRQEAQKRLQDRQRQEKRKKEQQRQRQETLKIEKQVEQKQLNRLREAERLQQFQIMEVEKQQKYGQEQKKKSSESRQRLKQQPLKSSRSQLKEERNEPESSEKTQVKKSHFQKSRAEQNKKTTSQSKTQKGIIEQPIQPAEEDLDIAKSDIEIEPEVLSEEEMLNRLKGPIESLPKKKLDIPSQLHIICCICNRRQYNNQFIRPKEMGGLAICGRCAVENFKKMQKIEEQKPRTGLCCTRCYMIFYEKQEIGFETNANELQVRLCKPCTKLMNEVGGYEKLNSEQHYFKILGEISEEVSKIRFHEKQANVSEQKPLQKQEDIDFLDFSIIETREKTVHEPQNQSAEVSQLMLKEILTEIENSDVEKNGKQNLQNNTHEQQQRTDECQITALKIKDGKIVESQNLQLKAQSNSTASKDKTLNIPIKSESQLQFNSKEKSKQEFIPKAESFPKQITLVKQCAQRQERVFTQEWSQGGIDLFKEISGEKLEIKVVSCEQQMLCSECNYGVLMRNGFILNRDNQIVSFQKTRSIQSETFTLLCKICYFQQIQSLKAAAEQQKRSQDLRRFKSQDRASYKPGSMAKTSSSQIRGTSAMKKRQLQEESTKRGLAFGQINNLMQNSAKNQQKICPQKDFRNDPSQMDIIRKKLNQQSPKPLQNNIDQDSRPKYSLTGSKYIFEKPQHPQIRQNFKTCIRCFKGSIRLHENKYCSSCYVQQLRDTK